MLEASCRFRMRSFFLKDVQIPAERRHRFEVARVPRPASRERGPETTSQSKTALLHAAEPAFQSFGSMKPCGSAVDVYSHLAGSTHPSRRVVRPDLGGCVEEAATLAVLTCHPALVGAAGWRLLQPLYQERYLAPLVRCDCKFS